MKRALQEYVFVAVVLFFIGVIGFNAGNIQDFGEGDPATGQAYAQAKTPFVKLISPDANSEITTNNVPFTYEVHNVNKSVCSLVIDGRIRDRRKVTQFAFKNYGSASVMQSLADGSHQWKVTCTLPSKETIASPTYSFQLQSPQAHINAEQQEREQASQDQNTVPKVTGNVAGSDGVSPAFKGLFVVLIGVAALIWGVRFAKE